MKGKTKLVPQVQDSKTAAEKLLEKDRQERITRCGARIQKVLEEEGCALDASILLRNGQVIPQISVVDAPKQN